MKAQNLRLSHARSCLLLLSLTCPTFAHLELVRIAVLPRGFAECCPCGDGNHNGLAEMCGTCGHQGVEPDTLFIAERVWGDSLSNSPPQDADRSGH